MPALNFLLSLRAKDFLLFPKVDAQSRFFIKRRATELSIFPEVDARLGYLYVQIPKKSVGEGFPKNLEILRPL